MKILLSIAMILFLTSCQPKYKYKLGQRVIVRTANVDFADYGVVDDCFRKDGYNYYKVRIQIGQHKNYNGTLIDAPAKEVVLKVPEASIIKTYLK